MIISSIKFRGQGCFKEGWSGFDTIRPINVIIGRNNSGKSHLIDFVEALCSKSLDEMALRFLCKATFDEDTLGRYFSLQQSGDNLGGNHWSDHGEHFVGVEVAWERNAGPESCSPTFPTTFNFESRFGAPSTGARLGFIKNILLNEKHHAFYQRPFRRLLVDRDIRPEPATNDITLRPDGTGATNIIRRNFLSSSPKLSRDLIQVQLISALNEIFQSDGRFTEIFVRHHDESGAHTGNNTVNGYEVYLGEDKKGLIALSRSGSGLKTVILVLINLLAVPRHTKHPPNNKPDFIFAFEELENNLHPSLLRRLLTYIEQYAVRENAKIFLTTHSSVALDLFGVSENAQIIHVTHDGESAHTQTVSAHFDKLGVLSELGAKPSDLLQANGIIWVEGPSDRVYLNRWIELFSGGQYREGRDYQCAFFGGALLARTQFAPPEEAEADLVNLLQVNPNVVVVCDSDRTAEAGPGSELKDRVKRVTAEVQKIPNAHIWVTGANEIENYLPSEALQKVFNVADIPSPSKHEDFFPRRAEASPQSYIERHLEHKTFDKVELASKACAFMTTDMLRQRFELAEEVEKIIAKIKTWSS